MSKGSCRACFIGLVVLWLAVLGGGCHRDESSAASAPQQQPQPSRTILATVYPLADVARQVAGDRANVLWSIQWLCESGADPRDFRPTQDQIRLAAHSDLVITSGFSEPWAGEMLNDARRDRQVLDLSGLAAAQAYGRSHGALWLDVSLVSQLTDSIRQRLAVIDHRHEDDYRRNTTAYKKALAELEEQFRSTLAPRRGRAFLSLRPTWQPMVERFGLTELAPINADPLNLTDDDVRTLQRLAKEKKTDVLAIDCALLPGVQRELQLRTGLHLLPLDLLGTSAPDGRSTYLQIMQYNLQQLVEYLK